MLVRGGAVLPLLPPDVDTLAEYGGAGITKLSDRADRLELIAFPRGDSSSAFYEDEELVSSEGDERWTLEVDGSTERTYRLQASLATLEQPFAACEVTLDGVPLAADAWSHDLATGVLEASFRTTDGTLEVSTCGSSVGDHRSSQASGERARKTKCKRKKRKPKKPGCKKAGLVPATRGG